MRAIDAMHNCTHTHTLCSKYHFFKKLLPMGWEWISAERRHTPQQRKMPNFKLYILLAVEEIMILLGKMDKEFFLQSLLRYPVAIIPQIYTHCIRLTSPRAPAQELWSFVELFLFVTPPFHTYVGSQLLLLIFFRAPTKFNFECTMCA